MGDHGRGDEAAAERALRCFAVGRNYAHDAVMHTLVSLLMTAKAAGIHPGDYFKDVLLRLSTCTGVKRLTPHGWKDHFAAEVAERRHALLQSIVAEA